MTKKILSATAALVMGVAAFGQTGKVGIGTTNPQAKLHVVGNVKIADGTQGMGKVLTSDSNGLSTWQNKELKTAEVRISGSKTFDNSWADVTGTVNYPKTNQIGISCDGTNIAVPQGKYLITLYYDISVWEVMQIELKNLTSNSVIMNGMYRDWFSPSSMLVEFNQVTNLKLASYFWASQSAPANGPLTYSTSPVTTAFEAIFTFVKLD